MVGNPLCFRGANPIKKTKQNKNKTDAFSIFIFKPLLFSPSSVKPNNYLSNFAANVIESSIQISQTHLILGAATW